jgi:hypothetical protein
VLRNNFNMSFYQLANNGVNYVNWTVAGTGTTKGANGIHLVADGTNEYASLPVTLEGGKQYTLVYTVMEQDLNSTIVISTYTVDVTQTIPNTVGIQKVLFTAKAGATSLRLILSGTNTDGKYINFTDVMIFEGDLTSNPLIERFVKYGDNSILSNDGPLRTIFFRGD